MNYNRIARLILCCLLLCTAAQAQDDFLTLKIMTYNIRHGAGMDDVLDLDRQAEVIRQAAPDVVALQEVDSVVKRSGRVDQAAYLASSLGMEGRFGAAIPLSGGKYGVAILSKESPLSCRNIPLPGTEKRTLLVCEFQEYVLACTHLDLDETCRLQSVPIILEEAARWDKPFFICGDWNDEPSSTLIKNLKKSFYFINATTNNSSNYTFPAPKPTIIIDYIASYGTGSARTIRSVRSRRVINEPQASDHCPVQVEVTLNRYSTPVSAPRAEAGAGQGAFYDLSGKKQAKGNLLPGLYIQEDKARKVLVMK